ncbi:hypothetical protein K7711_02680 [Nocardia sp. CA2R105]|uniref:hypothetical protein n=1 Tax=Nocardia coffeae TaxID=2873381 RepID=UPI001CA7288F|nr:hypothetical protein [Nocardia coffeae]MBY8855372.1 hypothetical protein [Nocardia coffeae]
MTISTSTEPIALLRAARDRAADARNLPRALELDNELEDLGQLGTAPRRTCWPCESWADHVHEPGTGERMPVHGGLLADDEHIATAVRAFALAATALPHHWTQTPTAAQVVVDLGRHQFTVTIHHGDTGDPAARVVYISGCVHRVTGQAKAFPAIHATTRGTAAIVTAYHYARYHGCGPITPAPVVPVRTEDPDDLLARFRVCQNQIDAEIDAHDGDPDTGDHHDRLAALHRDASELMAALDNHLTTGGALPRAWAHTRTA